VIATFQRSGTIRIIAWAVGFIALALLVAQRFELWHVWKLVEMPDGSTVRLANGWATVDHPFHVARAVELKNALLDGQLLRWFGAHQGGYPVEFYPLGAAWLDVGVWALTIGLLPMAVIHKIVIWGIVITPAFVYLWWAKRDGLSPGIALLAGTGHAVIAGWWWSGGWYEIALWGLVTNVAAQTAILVALGGVAIWLRDGRRRELAIAAIAVGFALGTNPRTFIALAAVGISAGIVALWMTPRIAFRQVAMRSALLVGLCIAVSAPALFPLLRYRSLYYFVHYSGYANLQAYLDSSVQAVSGPVFICGLFGIATGLLIGGRALTRTIALTALLYISTTAFLTVAGGQVVEQLELTRLMPFQRMLIFYLAALAIYDVIRLIGSKLETNVQAVASGALVVLAVGMAWFVVIEPASWVPVGDRGLQPVPTSAEAAIQDLHNAVSIADEQAQDGTALLVLGSVVSWHDPLWSTTWSDRRFFYDDWLWYWQKKNFGDYDPNIEHAYPIDTSTLNSAYLQTQGIGAVIVTDAPGQPNREIAAESPLLTPVATGFWYDVFLVNQPTPMVTSGGNQATSIDIGRNSIVATGTGHGQEITIRHNWYPRWKAFVNGDSVPITQTANGYMSVPAPDGDYTLKLEYEVTWLDWLGRALFVLGGAAIILLLIDRWPRRFADPRNEKGSGAEAPEPVASGS
jgi:hypothetical protein